MNPAEYNNVLIIAYLNIHGQTKLSLAKQVQIESFLKYNHVDIAHFQEIEILDDTFSECKYISSSFNFITNNAANKYGTASLVKNELCVENIRCDTSGRAIVFDIGEFTLGNFYGHSGTDAGSRASREHFFAEVLPQLITNTKHAGFIGGDWNCVIDKNDATAHADAKFSNSLKRVTKAFNMHDSFRSIHPKLREFSRYYSDVRGQGATRIDRQYHWGNVTIASAKHLPLAFSDHHSLIVSVIPPDPFSKLLCPRGRPSFRLQEEVISDPKFQASLSGAMTEWEKVRSFGLDTLQWWEVIVKPGIRRLASMRSRELRMNKNAELNLLLLRQAYLNKKLKHGHLELLGELNTIHKRIQLWYQRACSKVKEQARVDEFQSNEKVTIYHHEIHRKLIKKSAILKLETSRGVLEGHDSCAEYLENDVKNLLLGDAGLLPSAQTKLLEEVTPCFTDSENEVFLSAPSAVEVKETINNSNLHAAPGNDGIPSLFYKICWDTVGPALTEVMQEIHLCRPLPPSLRTSLMVFGSKPKKPYSIKPQDKRRISLLNSDFKVASGMYARRLKKTLTHTLSPLQLVAGDDRRIHHGINLARDAIWAAGRRGLGCGILDTDLEAGFDYMTLSWCLKVLRKKGANPDFIAKLKNLYDKHLSVVVVNNIPGAAIQNTRLTLRQGDVPSMELFSVGIDPLLVLLERSLEGILISSVPVQGPRLRDGPPLPELELRYKVIGYADDSKPAITSMAEFQTVDNALTLFENASGCKVHRDPRNQKCKFLALGRWRNTLQQEDIPCRYMTLSDHLDMVGVTLMASWAKTRKANGDELQKRVDNKIKLWKGGKFMPITQRSWSLNSFALSKLWFRTKCVDLRVCDVNNVVKSCKSWLYQDTLAKPEEIILHRPHCYGGLGMHSVKYKALASFITTFMQTAANPSYRSNLLHSLLYRKYVLEEEVPGVPASLPPYFSQELFSTIKKVRDETPLNIVTMKEKDWLRHLTEINVTMTQDPTGALQYIPCKAERTNPHTDWSVCWKACRQPGVPADLASFLWRLLHLLLCTQEKLYRMGITRSPICKMPNCQEEGSLSHELVYCAMNDDVGLKLLQCLQLYIPGLNAEALLRLDYGAVDDELSLPLTLLTAIVLNSVWKERESGGVQAYKVRADLEQYINLLRTSRLINTGTLLEEMMLHMFI